MKKIYLALILILLHSNFAFSEQHPVDWNLGPEEVRQKEKGMFENDKHNGKIYTIHFVEKFEEFIAYTSYSFTDGKLKKKYIFIDFNYKNIENSAYHKKWYLKSYDDLIKNFNNKYGHATIVYYKGVLDKSHKWVTKDTKIISDILVTDHSSRFAITYSPIK